MIYFCKPNDSRNNYQIVEQKKVFLYKPKIYMSKNDKKSEKIYALKDDRIFLNIALKTKFVEWNLRTHSKTHQIHHSVINKN